jgi:transcriptional regulator with XRE-family HTH domain
MTLGQKIAELRRSKGWTQTQLAEKVGVHPSHITRWERDKNQPSASGLNELAQHFEVSVEDLTKAHSKRLLQESIQDDELLSHFKKIQDLDKDDQATIMQVIDAFIVKKRMQKALGM